MAISRKFLRSLDRWSSTGWKSEASQPQPWTKTMPNLLSGLPRMILSKESAYDVALISGDNIAET